MKGNEKTAPRPQPHHQNMSAERKTKKKQQQQPNNSGWKKGNNNTKKKEYGNNNHNNIDDGVDGNDGRDARKERRTLATVVQVNNHNNETALEIHRAALTLFCAPACLNCLIGHWKESTQRFSDWKQNIKKHTHTHRQIAIKPPNGR